MDCRVTWANDAYRTLVLGGAAIVAGTAPWVNALPQERTDCEQKWRVHKESGTPFLVEFRIGTATGETIWVQVSAQQIVSHGVTKYIGTAIDCTAIVQQSALSQQLVSLLDASGDAVLVFDRVGNLQFANEVATTMIGVTESSLTSTDVAARTFMQAIKDQLPRELLEHYDPSSPINKWQGEIGFRSPDGLPRTLSVVVQVTRDRDGSVHHWSAIASDITEARQLQTELTRQATHDALTSLPNRVLILRKISEALERSRTTRNTVAVLFIDLDKLKHVNDTIGHAVGDQLIVTIAQRLVAATRPSDVVARIGGDEFVVLCEGLLDEHVSMEVADRIRVSISGSLILQGVEIESGASIGVALATQEMLQTESSVDAAITLLRCADTAMYRAKQRGRGRCELYNNEMHSAARERLVLSSQLEQALAARQFSLVYQPLISAHTGRTVAVEALLRWNHPERGELTPAAFLDLAEESGLISPIGDWVLSTASTAMREWIDSGLLDRHCALHVNVSRRQLSDTTFVDRASTILSETGLDAQQLVLETSESTLIDNNPTILRTVTTLKRQGVRIAVDDFGTGYSSLSSLRTFPADQLKLDGTLVRDVGRTDGGDDPIVRSLIQLAHSLDLTVVAEWVSTSDQVDRLRILGCDILQGNHISEPLTKDQLRDRYLGAGAGAGPVPAK
ncbi:MAG: EAL domain-containing protein [Actinobacteria bacterium]|nr:EAL domain-containing protein [Actinomycetota bacterium]